MVDERPIRDVPRAVIAVLGVALAAQLGWSSRLSEPVARATDLPAAPSPGVARLATFGDEATAARLMTLWLQSFDLRAGSAIPYRNLDYRTLVAWLDLIQKFDHSSQYPLLLASRIYAEVDDPMRQRQILDFVERAYREDPNRRWPAMAHATLVAKHRLKDLELARKFARTLAELTTTTGIPVWVRQMEAFILEDMNELEAARILIGGVIASGQVHDARDLELLKRRLEALERSARPPSAPVTR